MLATSALHLSGHRRRQIACRLETSLGVGRGEVLNAAELHTTEV